MRRARVVSSTYLISAFCTACAAVILGSRVMGSQNNVGQGYELVVLAGVILGGTSLLGGSGSIPKTVVGMLILGFIQNGLPAARLPLLHAVARHLGRHHPRGLARRGVEARPPVHHDQLREADMNKSPLRLLSRIPPIWMILIACVAFFSVFADSFFAVGNFTNILIQTLDHRPDSRSA